VVRLLGQNAIKIQTFSAKAATRHLIPIEPSNIAEASFVSCFSSPHLLTPKSNVEVEEDTLSDFYPLMTSLHKHSTQHDASPDMFDPIPHGVLDGLHDLHASGNTHGHLKPDNVAVSIKRFIQGHICSMGQ